jgi:uncharacterized protein DUF899
MVVLVRGDIELASWPLTNRDRPGLAVVDELARLQLAARRRGCSIRLRDACVELLELLDLLGLGEVVSDIAGLTERTRNMGITFPGESGEYRAARDRLLAHEIKMRRAMETVAAARRELPPGGVVPEDYVFQDASRDCSELLYAPPEPGQDPRHVGTIEPLWNLFDLTPEQLRYEGNL